MEDTKQVTDSAEQTVKIQTSGSQDLTDTVAKHYNELQEEGRASRTESRIYYMRNFNNWIKSILIAETLQKVQEEQGPSPDIVVLDLCSGKGGDLLKWKKGGISHLICADIAATSVEQSEVRYNEMVERSRGDRYSDRVFTAEFIAADCTKERLRDRYKNSSQKHHITSCQFSYHYCFESYPQAQMMLRNAVECLSLGGYFIGTTPNSNELVRRLHDSEDMSFGNEVYRVTFEGTEKQNFPLFGAKYNFHLEGVVDCPEFLVYFPMLEKLAEEHGMKLVYKKPFADFFAEHAEVQENKSLMGKMGALEMYPPDREVKLVGLKDEDYIDADKFHQELLKEEDTGNTNRSRRPPRIGTLSKAEWEAVTIYCVFMFQKMEDKTTGEKWTSPNLAGSGERVHVSRKRPREGEGEEKPSPEKITKHS